MRLILFALGLVMITSALSIVAQDNDILTFVKAKYCTTENGGNGGNGGNGA